MSLEIRFHGIRGSVPTPGSGTLKYGGNTTCVEVRTDDGSRVFLDAGSGLRSIPNPAIGGVGDAPPVFDILLTHYHLDHVEGLPFFPPLYDSRLRFRFHGPDLGGVRVGDALRTLLRPPWFPISFEETPSAKEYVDLQGKSLSVGGVDISYVRQEHPQGSVAYRLEYGGRVVVFATDVERGKAESDDSFDALARDADLLIHDAQYTPDEYEKHRGWGHSTWRRATEIAGRSGSRRLVLCHHDPDRTDGEIDRIVRDARGEFPDVEAAREGAVITL